MPGFIAIDSSFGRNINAPAPAKTYGRMPCAADVEIGGKGGPLIGGGPIEIDALAAADPDQTSQFGEILERIAAIVVVAGEGEGGHGRLIPGLG